MCTMTVRKVENSKRIETKTYKSIYLTTGFNLHFAPSVGILQMPLAFTKGQFGPGMSA